MGRGASVAIVGGGIWGLSTAYHLALAGWTDLQVLERNDALFDETTSQAAGLVGQIRATPLMRRAIRYAIDLFLHPAVSPRPKSWRGAASTDYSCSARSRCTT